MLFLQVRMRLLSFTHTAYSKSVFAKGAIEAAKFLLARALVCMIWGMLLHPDK